MTSEGMSVTRSAQLRAVGDPWARTLPGIFAAKAMFFLGVLALTEFPPWRIATIALLDLIVISVVWASPQERSASSAMRVLLLVLITQGTVIALTGGLASPLVGLLVVPLVVGFSLFGRTRQAALIPGVVAIVLVALVMMPREWTVMIDHPTFELLALGALLITGAMVTIAVLALSDAYWSAGHRLRFLRDGVLADQELQKHDLEIANAKLAHELKNPLSAIKGLIHSERERAVDERSHKRFTLMATEIDRMEAILHDYLSFARPRDTMRIVDVDLRAMIENVLAVLEGRAECADVHLSVSGPPVMLGCDPQRLKEALLNLATNSLEATPRGGSVAFAINQSSRGATVTISDTGKGMTEGETGSGLGVALARTVVTQHGGRLAFASTLARGTTVRVDLPRVPIGAP